MVNNMILQGWNIHLIDTDDPLGDHRYTDELALAHQNLLKLQDPQQIQYYFWEKFWGVLMKGIRKISGNFTSLHGSRAAAPESWRVSESRSWLFLENINFYIPIEEQNETAGDINEADNIPYQEPTKEQFNEAEGTYSQEELTASGEYNAEIDQESGSLDTLSPVVKAEEFINEAPTPTGYDAEEYIVSEDISEQLDDQTIGDQINNIEKESINTIIDTLIRPALLRDGGDLNIIDYNNNVLTISYKGACITCPHAEEGTLNAMQNILKEKFNPDIVINIAKNANEAKSEELDSQFDEESTDYSDNYDSHLIQEEQLELSIEQNDLSAKKEINTSFDFKSLENDTNINNETENFDT